MKDVAKALRTAPAPHFLSMLYSHLEHHHERVALHKGRPVFASSKYTPALLGRGVRPKLVYDLLGHTPVTMILECYSHAGSS